MVLRGWGSSSLTVAGEAVSRGRNAVRKADWQGQKCVWRGRRELEELIDSIKWSGNPLEIQTQHMGMEQAERRW